MTSGYSKHRTPRAWFPTSRISRLVLLTLGTGLVKWTSPHRFCEGRPSPTSEGLGSPRGIRGGVGAGCGAGRCGTEVVVLLARLHLHSERGNASHFEWVGIFKNSLCGGQDLGVHPFVPGLFWDVQFKTGKRMGQGLGSKGRRMCGHQMATHSVLFQLHSISKSNGILLKVKHQVLLLWVLHSQQILRLWQRLLAHVPSFAY